MDVNARHQLAIALYRDNRPLEALQQLAGLIDAHPDRVAYRSLRADIHAAIGDASEAAADLGALLAVHPEEPRLWLQYGQVSATLDAYGQSVAAFRRCIALSPQMGEAWWGLANLKTYRFESGERQLMQSQFDRVLDERDRIPLEFAVGKALEDEAQYATAFAHYARGNHRRRARSNYDARAMTAFVRHSKQVLDRGLFGARGDGELATDVPIFIVGLPRAGSTLVEQILASHSLVEGTMELPDLVMIAGALARRGAQFGRGYPDMLADLTAADRQRLARRYLDGTWVRRKTSKPLFVDKTPHNFLHIGLISMILPHAKIIDARREPLSCCLSAFKQYFADGHRFSFDLADLGYYYRDYVDLMQHFDAVLPGKVHRVQYERMVKDTEVEIRRLLDFCGLDFEAACLDFDRTPRPVATPSAFQVRKPIYRDALEQWRCYEPWLQPLKNALGRV
jgi:tetratricopeptide (TPR) repeat protein